MKYLIKELMEEGILKTPSIIGAFEKVDRKDFVPEELKDKAYLNTPLPIGYGQTISQPLTVAFMLELLQPQAGDKVLEVGSGSGWQTALLACIVSGNRPATQATDLPRLKILNVAGRLQSRSIADDGKVIAVELISELMDFGRKNAAKYGFIKKGTVEFHSFNATKGMPEEAPFDRIISAASGHDLPEAWKEQLKIGGRIVAPIKDAIHLLVKKGENEFEETVYPGFAFVPLINLNE